MNTALRTGAVLCATILLPLTAAQAMSDKPHNPGGNGGNPGSGSPASVPEPGVLGLFATGIVGLYVGRRMARKRKG